MHWADDADKRGINFGIHELPGWAVENPMARSRLLVGGVYQVGVVSVAPMPVPAGLSYAAIYIDVWNLTDPAQGIRVTLEFSLNGGASWDSRSFTFWGRPRRPGWDRALAMSKVACEIPDSTHAPRLVRGSIEIIGAPVDTFADIDLKVYR